MDTPIRSTAGPAVPGSTPGFRELLRRVLTGDDEAARQLQEQYGEYIIMAVRRRMPRRLRSKFDSVDFVQDVWASFFRTPQRHFNGPDHLVAYLTRMAQNKVVDATREGLETQKRDLAREEPLATASDDQEVQRIFDRDGTPSEAAIGRELWDLMLAGEPPAYRAVLTLLRDGLTQAAVAERLKLSIKTVQRILERALEKTRS
jgi:RNA polymerase sigma factor (sigma-70 family)